MGGFCGDKGLGFQPLFGGVEGIGCEVVSIREDAGEEVAVHGVVKGKGSG